MLCGKPLFCGANDMSTLEAIFDRLGAPSQTNWPSCVPLYNSFKEQCENWTWKDRGTKSDLREACSKLEPAAVNLLEVGSLKQYYYSKSLDCLFLLFLDDALSRSLKKDYSKEGYGA